MDGMDVLKELESLVNSFVGQAKPRYMRIRKNALLELHNLNYDSIRREICMCIIMGLHQASITLTNHYMEKFLKLSLMEKQADALHIKDLASLPATYKNPKQNYNSKELQTTINQACTQGIITKEEKSKLHRFRDDFRNAYSHADMDKTFKGQTGNFAFGKLDGSLPLEMAELKISDIPPFQGLYQQNMAEKEATDYFLFLDEIVCREQIKKYPDILKYQRQ